MPRFAFPALIPVVCAALLLSPGLGVAQTVVHPVEIAATPATEQLGDLSAYRNIAEDTLRIVKTGDLPAAKARIKDLETTWDEAEAKLRPRNKEKWRVIDKAIDNALARLRADSPDASACADALQSLIAVIDTTGAA
jgi:hypothetical protein